MSSRKEMVPTIRSGMKAFVCVTSIVFLAEGALMFASASQTDDSAAQTQIGHNSTTFVVEIKEHASSTTVL